MIYLTIAWVLLTLPVFLIGMCVMDAINPPDYGSTVNAFASLFIFVPIWWFIYCLIRLGFQ